MDKIIQLDLTEDDLENLDALVKRLENNELDFDKYLETSSAKVSPFKS